HRSPRIAPSASAALSQATPETPRSPARFPTPDPAPSTPHPANLSSPLSAGIPQSAPHRPVAPIPPRSSKTTPRCSPPPRYALATRSPPPSAVPAAIGPPHE